MSKKEQLPALKVSMAGQEVAAGIDMRLTKSDLIEMAVEERKEELEKLINKLAKDVHDRENAVRGLRDSEVAPKALVEAITALAEKEHKVLLKAFRAAAPGAKTSTSQRFYHAYEIRRVEDPTQEHGTRGKSEKLTKLHLGDVAGCIDRYGDEKKPYFTLQLQVTNKPDRYSDTTKNEPDMHLTLEFNAPKDVFEAHRAECKKTMADYVDVYNNLVDLRTELSELGRKGGRYKAELTKRLLSGSEAGKELLGAMESVRALMFTDSSKK